MLEEQIKKIMLDKKLSAENIYKPLEINRINFYKAIKTSNLNNRSLRKVLKFLGVKIIIKLKKYENNSKKVL